MTSFAVAAVACLVLAACGSQDAAQNASATTVQEHTQHIVDEQAMIGGL